MTALNLLIKPVSAACNLACTYCFYRRTAPCLAPMTGETAETVIARAFAAGCREVIFGFQGGEPTLAGLDFYRAFVETARRLRPAGVTVSYTLQTNGTLLDRQWAAFFRENHFLVGVSLDGTPDLHNARRCGSWDRAAAGLRLLREAGVETNALCVVTEDTLPRAEAVYRSLRGLGAEALQFIPCIGEAGSGCRSVSARGYGSFLCTLFDLWYADWAEGRYVSLRAFDDLIHQYMGLPPGCCTAAGDCGAYWVVEADGSVYPCDFYVGEAYRMGSLVSQSCREIAEGRRCADCRDALRRLPEDCGGCRWFALCRGGCARIRREYALSDFCAAKTAFYAYTEARCREIAEAERALTSLLMP